MLSITCGSPHREEKSVLQTIIKNLAINCGFIMGALLMFFGIMDFKKILEQAKSPQRHASATFFLYQIHPKSLSIILDKAKEGLKHARKVHENKSSWQIKSSVLSWPNPSPIALHQASCPGGHYCKL
ncbi:hypothetical protein Peur_047998 [Populus x canadensis]